MKSILFPILSIILFIPHVLSQSIPEGYILQYGQKFVGNKGLGDFRFSNPSQWELFKLQSNSFLLLSQQNGSAPQVVCLPPNKAILKNRIFGDFILEADVMPGDNEVTSGEFCLFLGMKDSTKYYFILLSTDPANELQGIYLVKNSCCTKLPLKTSSPRPLVLNAWQKIRVERNIVKRTIRVFAGDLEKPLLEVKDYELVMGSLGFGSLNSQACIDNVSIWAPTMIEEGDEGPGTRDK
jgi:hypothetical protein